MAFLRFISVSPRKNSEAHAPGSQSAYWDVLYVLLYVCQRQLKCVTFIDILYTLNGASHTAGRRKLHEIYTEHDIICVFCIAEKDKVDNKSSFMQLKSI